jgi:hypothetical protein
MFKARNIAAVSLVLLFWFAVASAKTLDENWNDYLHYTLIGRLDLAKAHAKAILESNPDPVALLNLMQANPQSYAVLQKAKQTPHDPELAELSGKIWDVIEKGRFAERSKATLIVQEIERLSTTPRGYLAAVERLRNSGEYAIPFMLEFLADPSKKQQQPDIVKALPEIGRDAIRPLAAALQTKNVEVKTEIIKALGKIAYPQALPYLKYVVEKDDSAHMKALGQESISRIDPAAGNTSAASLFYKLGENYYYHADSLAPAEDANFANVWFWDPNAQKLSCERVHRTYFNELMSMQCCEWALKADGQFGPAIALWIAAFFKAESTNNEMPNYFGKAHADALTYATTAGPQYLHQALARAIGDKNAYVSLGVIEAMVVNAGEKSLFYRLGEVQPLVQALTFSDRAVRYSAAIAIAAAGPRDMFPERNVVVRNLAEAIGQPAEKEAKDMGVWNERLAYTYALRSVNAMLQLAVSRNTVIDLSQAQTSLIKISGGPDKDIKVLACQVLAYLNSPDAQRAIAAAALDQANPLDIRIAAFGALAVSAKINASLLDDEQVNAIFALAGSVEAPAQLRGAAAAAYGALNLPSQRVKDLILDQSKS